MLIILMIYGNQGVVEITTQVRPTILLGISVGEALDLIAGSPVANDAYESERRVPINTGRYLSLFTQIVDVHCYADRFLVVREPFAVQIEPYSD